MALNIYITFLLDVTPWSVEDAYKTTRYHKKIIIRIPRSSWSSILYPLEANFADAEKLDEIVPDMNLNHSHALNYLKKPSCLSMFPSICIMFIAEKLQFVNLKRYWDMFLSFSPSVTVWIQLVVHHKYV
jgi:hypothetical protein